ncbi:MAG: class I SAM-dependent methyltransferase [Chloroflexi bacterium]|nr:class I SAM-dependent methyltransferase [Chloroflexota bacterium]MCH8877780.1 class I SAM-dependent methyltransferase [Chloroflexota bacterium]
MPTVSPDPSQISAYVANLLGPDPYIQIRQASFDHREAHGEDCDVHPSNPLSMRLLYALVRGCHAERVLEIGCGLGYSAAWLAEAVGPHGKVETIERDPVHVDLAQEMLKEAGLDERIQILRGEANEVVKAVKGRYRLIYDDAWFMAEPKYLERVVDLLHPGGLLVMANWFPLADAIEGGGDTHWAQSFGADWAELIQAYASNLATHRRLRMAFSLDPWLGLAVKID